MVMTNLMASWGKNANSDADRFIAAHVVKTVISLSIPRGGPSCVSYTPQSKWLRFYPAKNHCNIYYDRFMKMSSYYNHNTMVTMN